MTVLTTTLTRLRAELRHTAGLRGAFDRYEPLHDAYADAVDDTERQRIGGQIAGLVEQIAGHLEASRLARATTALPTPAELRAEAAEWRAGTMSVGP